MYFSSPCLSSSRASSPVQNFLIYTIVELDIVGSCLNSYQLYDNSIYSAFGQVKF